MKLDCKYFGTICIGLMSSLSCLRAIFVLAECLLVVFSFFVEQPDVPKTSYN